MISSVKPTKSNLYAFQTHGISLDMMASGQFVNGSVKANQYRNFLSGAPSRTIFCAIASIAIIGVTLGLHFGLKQNIPFVIGESVAGGGLLAVGIGNGFIAYYMKRQLHKRYSDDEVIPFFEKEIETNEKYLADLAKDKESRCFKWIPQKEVQQIEKDLNSYIKAIKNILKPEPA